jgi:DNA polymerase III subunit beta
MLTVDAKDFLGLIERAASACARKTRNHKRTVPILGMVKVVCDETGTTCIGTDLDMEMRATSPSLVAEGFLSFMADPKILRAILGRVKGQVTIKRTVAGMNLSAGDIEANLIEVCQPIDFPTFNRPADDARPVMLTESVLHTALSKALPFVSTEETRYYLNGVYLEHDENTLRTVATDGHRLFSYKTEERWHFNSAILPRESAKVLAAQLRAGGNGTISVHHNPAKLTSFMRFAGEGFELSCKLIDGTFPAWRGVLPKGEGAESVTIDRAAINALPRLAMRGDYGSRPVLSVDPESARMSTKVVGLGEVSAPAQTTGKKKFGFNRDYVTTVVKSCGEPIRLQSGEDGVGGPFRVVCSDPAITAAIMPMRV